MSRSKRMCLPLMLLVTFAIANGATVSNAFAGEVNWQVNGKYIKAGEEKTYEVGETTIKIKDGSRTFECKGQTIKGQLKKGTIIVKIENFGTCQMISPKKVAAKIKSKDLPWAGNLIQKSKQQSVEFPAVGLEIEVEGEETSTIEGSQEGEWNNTGETINFPESPLEGTKLKDGKEPVVWSGGYPVTLGGGEKLKVTEELGIFESTNGKATDPSKSGKVVLEGGGATLECASAEGKGTIENQGAETTKGHELALDTEKWNGCKASSKEFKELTPKVKACTVVLNQDPPGSSQAKGFVGTECTVTTTVLFLTCTIHIASGKAGGVNFGLEPNELGNIGSNLLIEADDSGITTTTSGSCPGISGSSNNKLSSEVSVEGVNAV